MAREVPLGILISGGGTNLQAIIDAIEEQRLDAVIRLVISNREDAYGLIRARNHGIETEVMDHRKFPTREAYDQALIDLLKARHVELVILAGFMRILTPYFIGRFPEHILNIHPSLLPDFKGLEPQKQALEAGVPESGCSVHVVSAELDSGSVIAQRRVAIQPDDTVESLSARILEQEHLLYPKAIALYLEQMRVVDG